jgi:hypothetical protein
MTIQTPNIYAYQGQFHWSPDVDDEGIINRNTFPELSGPWCCTACYRGFTALFEIDEERGLVLKELDGLNRENPKPIEGVEATILLWDEVTSQEDMQGRPRGCRYTLNKPMDWSGSMRLVKLRSRDLVAECFFENGQLVHVNDLSGTTLDDWKPPTMAEADLKEAARLLSKLQSVCSVDEQAIRDKAYQLWLERGCPEGSAEQDWHEAKRLLLE